MSFFLWWLGYNMFCLIVGLFRNRWLVAVVTAINIALILHSFQFMVERWPQIQEDFAYYQPLQLATEYWKFMILPLTPLGVLGLGVIMSLGEGGKLTWREFRDNLANE